MAGTNTATTDRMRLIGRALCVSAGVLRDKVAPKRVLHADDVPGSVEKITPEWLTTVLCKDSPGARILNVRLTGGDAGSCTRQGLELTLNQAAHQAGIPARLFSKSAPNFVQRIFLGLSGAAYGESRFYTEIRPQLDIEAPQGYYAAIDQISWRALTLMNDIAHEKGATFISTETHITKAMMADLLANMAKWHGYFWNSPQLTSNLSWLRTTAQYLDGISRSFNFKSRALSSMEKYPHLLPDDLHGQGDTLFEAMVRGHQIDLQQPATFLHGDAHIGQTYITQEGRMGYSDWQLVQRGSWASDFAYSVASALTIEDRRSWEKELLQGYLEALHAAGGPILDFDTAWIDYRQHTLYPFFAWAFTRAGAGSVMPDMQRDYVCNDIMKRTAHAVSDLKAAEAVE